MSKDTKDLIKIIVVGGIFLIILLIGIVEAVIPTIAYLKYIFS